MPQDNINGLKFKGITSTALDDKPTKGFGPHEENKFSIGNHQFLLDSCPKLTKTSIMDRFQTVKDIQQKLTAFNFRKSRYLSIFDLFYEN